MDPGWIDLAGKLLTAITTLGVAYIGVRQQQQRNTQKEHGETLKHQDEKLEEIKTEVNGKSQALMNKADHLVERTARLETEIRRLNVPGSSTPAGRPGGSTPVTLNDDEVSTEDRKP